MSIFFHHVGDQNSQRDFPRTVGTATIGVMRFVHPQLAELGAFITEDFRDEYFRYIDRNKAGVFQIWGVPDGAVTAFSRLAPDDYWMLLDSPRHGGGMQYIGRVDFKIGGKQFDLSKQLWTESRFPYVFLMHGSMIYFSWMDFVDHFSYSDKYDPRGNVCGIAAKALRNASTHSEQGFVDFLLGNFSVGPK